MRLIVHHRTTYLYDDPPRAVLQILRLTPRDHEGLRVRRWRVDVDHDAHLVPGEDAFGNVMHTLSLTRAHDDLTIAVEGEVETHDTSGVLRATIERFPPGLFLRDTPLTTPDADIKAFARDAADGREPLEALHTLLVLIHRTLRFDVNATDVGSTAAQAFARRSGVCQDFAHLLIAAARSLEIPARYVSGYMLRTDAAEQKAGHAWVEAHVPVLGWVGFDPANGISPTDAHVRVSVGLDYQGAAPVRGSRSGGSAEILKVNVTVDQALRQHQG